MDPPRRRTACLLELDPMKHQRYLGSLVHTSIAGLFVGLILSGCNTADSPPKILRVAVTTSTRDSGLLDELIPPFEQQYNARVDIIAQGTGAALQLGRSGDVDVVIVHARTAEDQFMQDGHGARREDLMYNTFLIAGPNGDPASVATATSPPEAMQAIANSKCKFVSRGDNSGTHQREQILWQSGGGRPTWPSYIESGQGMGATLNMAEEMQAYVLTDLGTFLRYRGRPAGLQLASLSKSHEDLANPYGIIVVSTERNATGSRLANAFVDFMISAETQQKIQDFRVSGEQLFFIEKR